MTEHKPMSNGDLERLHHATAQAMSVRDYCRREVRRREAELGAKRDELMVAEEAFRRLETQSETATAPKLGEALS